MGQGLSFLGCANTHQPSEKKVVWGHPNGEISVLAFDALAAPRLAIGTRLRPCFVMYQAPDCMALLMCPQKVILGAKSAEHESRRRHKPSQVVHTARNGHICTLYRQEVRLKMRRGPPRS